MIKAIFFQDSNHIIKGFRVNGHAGYADSGNDIICAAVSALTVNAVNSIVHFTDDKFTYKDKAGFFEFRFKETESSPEAQLLLHSLLLGLQAIQKDYSAEYISVTSKEV